VVPFAGEVRAIWLQRRGVAIVFQILRHGGVFLAVDGKWVMHLHMSGDQQGQYARNGEYVKPIHGGS
jgi:hypothetical protein